MTLKELIPTWDDSDGAMFSMGVCLGLWPNDWAKHGLKHKWVFWTDNPLGNKLYGCLVKFVEIGILLENEEGQFKWNDEFTIEKYDEAVNGEWKRQHEVETKKADEKTTTET